MAGDWIKYDSRLDEKPEIARMARALGQHCYFVAGACGKLWGWASANASVDDLCPDEIRTLSDFCPDVIRTDSDTVVALGVTRLSCDDLNSIMRVDNFAEALIDVGWLREVTPGLLVFPKWDLHNSKSAKARALDSRRKGTGRSPRPDSVRSASGSKPEANRKKPGNVSGKVPDANRKQTGPDEMRDDEMTSPPYPPRGDGGGGEKISDPPDPPPPRRLPLIAASDLRDRTRVDALVADRLDDPSPDDLEGAWRLAQAALEQDDTEPGAYFHRRVVDRCWPELKADPGAARSQALARMTAEAIRERVPPEERATPEELQAALATVRSLGSAPTKSKPRPDRKPSAPPRPPTEAEAAEIEARRAAIREQAADKIPF